MYVMVNIKQHMAINGVGNAIIYLITKALISMKSFK